MQENHPIWNTVEGQNTSPVVHINSYSVGTGDGYGHSVLVVLEGTGRRGTVQTPGFGVVSQLAVAPGSLPGHAFVTQSHGDPSHSAPFDLPVAAAGHARPTQHLGPAGEAPRVLWVWLGLGPCGHPSPPIRQDQIWVGCAGVQ